MEKGYYLGNEFGRSHRTFERIKSQVNKQESHISRFYILTLTIGILQLLEKSITSHRVLYKQTPGIIFPKALLEYLLKRGCSLGMMKGSLAFVCVQGLRAGQKKVRFQDRKIFKLVSQQLKARDMTCARKNCKLDSLKVSIISTMKMLIDKKKRK